MPLRGTPRVDPQQPSTSAAFNRRCEENRQKFEKLYPKNAPTTLWEVCTAKQRGLTLKSSFPVEVRDLRGLSFQRLLRPHESYLNDLTRICGITFQDLCQALRFLAYYKKVPVFKTNNEDAMGLFKLVSNCVIYSSNTWMASVDKSTILDSFSVKVLKARKAVSSEQELFSLLEEMTEKKVKEEEVKNSSYAYPPHSSNHTSIPCPIKRLRDREKVPIPPPPSCKHQKVSYDPLDDENIQACHRWNYISSHDTKFTGPFERALKTIIKNNKAIRTKDTKMSDIEYYGDNSDLKSTHLSFRLASAAQIINFEFPNIQNDGYFCADCPDYSWYLYENYQKANYECCTALSAIRPPSGRPIKPGFLQDTLQPEECFNFHMVGRHIHGFFDVWRETNRGWQEPDGKWVPRRYLVDIYNQIMFPLYVDLSDWPIPLRWAFDKYSMYGLKLMSMVRRHPQALKNAGDLLFSPYPAYLNECTKHDLTSAKGRSHYYQLIEIENNRVVDRYLNGSATPYKLFLDDDGRKRKRKARKSDETPLKATIAPKLQRAPRKSLETPKYIMGATTNQRAMHPQKENMDRPLTNPPGITTITPIKQSPAVIKNTPTTTPVAMKRRFPEYFTPVTLPPPTKKVSMSITTDSWDDHVHNSADEEHVDEEKPIDELDSDGRQNVWVPQDRGHEVAPEQYAREIVDHYIAGTRENSSPPQPPPMPTPKTPRRRKSGQKTPNDSVSSSTEGESSTPSKLDPPPPVTSSASSTSTFSGAPKPLPLTNGHRAVLPGPIQPRVQYSMKPQVPPIANKTVYPVKKLTPSPVTSSPAVVNGTSSASTSSSSTPSNSVAARNSIPYPHKTPYFPASSLMRRYNMPQPLISQPLSLAPHNQNGVDSTMTPTATTPSILKASAQPVRNAVQCYQQQLILPQPPTVPATPRSAETFQTPASRAIAHQKNMIMGTELCRRVMPFNTQMVFKKRQWDPEPKSSSVPPNISPPSKIPYVRKSVTTNPTETPSVQPSNIPPIAAPTVIPSTSSATSSNANERSVGVPKSRQYVPWIANSRAMTAAATSTANEAMENGSSGSPTSMPAPTTPSVAPEAALANIMRSMMDSDPALLPLRAYTNHIRKQHGTMTPEQLGDAIRNESQRFQEEGKGEEGPSLKSFVMNLKQ